jgi:glutaredoxin-related protein
MEIYMVYGVTDCPACLRACADLMEKDKEYIFIETDFSKTYRTTIKEEFSWSTFPIVIRIQEHAEEELVGGYDELKYILEKESTAPT